MRVLLGLCVGLAIGVGTVARANQQPAGTYTVYGTGNASCGAWIAETNQKAFRLLWTLGFETGAGSLRVKMRDSDSAGMSAWVDQYCAVHPLSTVADASIALVEELRTK
jgi:hypothetical protein